MIGEIKDVEACFTKLVLDKTSRELDIKEEGGSITEWAFIHFYQFQQDGLRYETAEFLNMINNQKFRKL